MFSLIDIAFSFEKRNLIRSTMFIGWRDIHDLHELPTLTTKVVENITGLVWIQNRHNCM